VDPTTPRGIAPLQTELDEYLRSRRIERFINILVLVIGIPAAIIAMWDIVARLSNIEVETAKIQERQRTLMMQIFQPRNNDIVGTNMVASGYSPFADRNNYLIVTDGKAGVNYVQNGKIRVGPSGSWSHTATIGDANSCGTEFLVTAIATNQVILTPTVEPLPADAAMAPTIRVRREPCKQ
jgi:hypothetical protein